jgi:pyruvate dehydrogenase E2 component (dihydrolipoamide acetyltransferase)
VADQPGDKVTRGQIVAVVETTKAAVEVECWQEGTVSELLVPIGETVQVGTSLATLLAPGERAEKRPRVTAKPQSSTGAAGKPTAPPSARAAAVASPGVPGRRRWVSPAARRLAQSLHVDIDAVSGTGPQGAVIISDVEHAAAALEHLAAAEKPTAKPKAKPTAADRAAQMRKSIAAAMSRSKREIPHYYLAQEIILETSLNWLTTRNAQRSIDERVLPAVLLLKAVGIAAQRFGEFNGFWRDDGFEPATGVHVGVGISLRGGGLVAPAIHDVPEKKLDELMDDLTDLVARARSFSLRSSEMSDPTITVTNLGDKGVDAVFGVIYPPQVAIAGFGQPAQRVCVIDGGIRVVTAVQATLAADHRASDGHRGALFLTAINELLQQPDLLEK